MTVQAAQAPQRASKWPKKGPRLWVGVTKDEARKARLVARHEGLARGWILRKYSLNQLLAMHEQLFGQGK